MAEKVQTASIIAKKSLGVMWMNPIGGTRVLVLAASEGPADAGSGSGATGGE